MTTEKHSPKEWQIVNQNPLVLHSMCVCGDGDCYFSTSPRPNEMYASHDDPTLSKLGFRE